MAKSKRRKLNGLCFAGLTTTAPATSTGVVICPTTTTAAGSATLAALTRLGDGFRQTRGGNGRGGLRAATAALVQNLRLGDRPAHL